MDVLRAHGLKALIHYAIGQFRAVTLPAQMPEVQMTQISRHDVLSDLGGGFV